MRLLGAQQRGSSQAFDFTPVLFVTVFAFLAVGLLDFLRSWAGGEHGLLLFERACPIYQSAPVRPKERTARLSGSQRS